MANSLTESLSELEREAEADRARLAQTVDAIQERVSPAAIKANVRTYARQQGENVLSQIESQFRQNPLQSAAIAAGVAYPLVRMVTKLPVPILLIGAGVALSHRQTDSSYHRTSYGNGNGSTMGEDMKERVSSTVDGLKENLSSTASQVSSRINQTIGTVQQAASSTATRASEMLSETYESGKNTAATAVNQASETYSRARNNLIDQIERHPLIAGGIAFAVGSLVASALPVTRQENRLMGEGGDAVRERARRAAAEGMDYAQSTAGKVYDSVSSEVRNGDLSPSTARRTVRSAVASAADALNGAMENQNTDQSSGQSGLNRSNSIRENDNE